MGVVSSRMVSVLIRNVPDPTEWFDEYEIFVNHML